MKYVYLRKNNTKNQKPHTNTLNTKTIRTKSWRNPLLLAKRTPATIGIVAGFLLATGIPTAAALFGQRYPEPTTLDDTYSIQADSGVYVAPTDNSTQPDNEQPPEEAPLDKPQPSSEANDVSVHIRSNTESNTSTQSDSSAPSSTVTINGEEINLPKSGTYRKTINEDGSKTTIRIRGGANNSSVSIESNIRAKEGP